MGYHQIPCSEKAKQALAFSPGYGFSQMTWKTMPEGVKTAASYFQRGMCTIFKDRESCVLPPFFDDIVIKGKGFKSHLKNARLILQDIKKAGFTLNALKCAFFQKSIPYLGHIISENKIQIDPKRIEAITNLPPPTNQKSLRSFIGMVQFCHKFVNNLNVILAPLYNLLKANQVFKWTSECQAVFLKLKSMLCKPPVLCSPTIHDKFIFESDASDVGIGGCLKAVNDNGEFVVGYCSKKFDAEKNWNIVEKEAYAIARKRP